jgi:transcriptional regulator with XRE-family HTH domain
MFATLHTGGQLGFRLMRTEIHNPRETLARNLRQVMERLQRSARDVADACGLSNKTVSNILNGAHSVTLDSASAVANEIGVPLWQLLSPEIDREIMGNPDLARLMDFYFNASPEGRARILRNARLEALDASGKFAA